MSNLKHPVTLNRSTGFVVGSKNFYTAKAVVLNTSYGEVVVASSDESAIQHASGCIMDLGFKLDIDAAQNIAIFDAKYVTSSDSHDKLTSENKLLREALVKLVGQAKEYDSWESFPEVYINEAIEALEQKAN
jgi:hypothetical protein